MMTTSRIFTSPDIAAKRLHQPEWAEEYHVCGATLEPRQPIRRRLAQSMEGRRIVEAGQQRNDAVRQPDRAQKGGDLASADARWQTSCA